MFKAISVRLLFGLVSLLFISFVTFMADELAPGDAATVIAGDKATPEAVERIRENLGLNQPWPIRYVKYLASASRGDFGTSTYGTKEPVRDILARAVPSTAKVASYAILLASLVGITLGTLAAIKENRWVDRAILVFSTLGVTVPNFVLAPLLVLIFAVRMDRLPVDWQPPSRQVAPEWMYLLLPVFILSLRPGALLTRLTRASMIETLQQEFIRTAIAKGVPRMRIFLAHALRNAILPVITAIGTSFGFLLTGSFVIEGAFRIPGLGRRVIEAIQQGDMPVIQAGVLVTGVTFVVLNLIIDLIQPILDPRIRESQV